MSYRGYFGEEILKLQSARTGEEAVLRHNL